MPIYNKDSRLNEPIIYDPSIIQVINRFGIYLGVGDATILDVCKAHEIDVDFFLAIINTYLNRDYFPDRIAGKGNRKVLLDYLDKTDAYYRDVQLPNIERHFTLLISKSGMNEDKSPESRSNLHLLKEFFEEVKAELLGFIGKDEKDRIGEGEQIEEKIGDLISFFVIHLRGSYDRNLCVAVVVALTTLAKDLQQNNRIRDRILHGCLDRK